MKKIFLTMLLTLFVWGQGFSQEYLQMIEDGGYTVEEIVTSAEAYFANKDKGRGSGYKQFKRWEYMAKRLMNESGYLVPFEEQLSRLENYNAYLNQTASNRQPMNDNWVEMGPTSWNATTSWNPGVGRITGISVDPNNNDHIIVGANTGGVWKTTDAGANWTPLGDYFSNLYVYSVAIDPSNPNTYYFGSYGGIIYQSTDAGATWNAIGNAGNSTVNKILIHPSNSNILFASSEASGIYRSTNGGSSWTNVIPSENRGYDIEFKPNDPTTVYASGFGVHVSTNGGANFTSVSGFDGGPKMMGVSPDDATVVYVVEADGGSFGGFYKSTDSGQSYTELNHANRNYFGYDTAGFNPGGQAPRDMDVAVNPNNVNEVHIAGILTWRSLDGGVNFTCTSDWIPDAAANANIGYCHADVDLLEFVNTTLYAGTDGGIFKATNTTNLNADYYEDITTGIGIRQFYKIGISQTPEVVVSGGAQDNGTSFYTQSNGWIDWLGADGMESFVDKDNTDVMYGTSQNGQLYRTDNGAGSITGLPEPGQGSGNWVTPFEQDPIVTNTIYLGYNFVYKSTDKGNNWTSISQNFGDNLNELKIAPSNNQIMYAARGGLLYRTDDGGATNWEQSSPSGIINSIAIHPTNPNKVAVATTSANKVFVTEDGGETWENYRFNLPNFSALAVVWDDNGEDGLYVGMNYGIYYIDNTFEEWQPYFTNLPNVIVNELEINTEDGNIYAGTYGRGLWASPKFEPEVLGNTDFVLVNEFSIAPNPVEEQLQVYWKESEAVALRIFDVSGKLVIYQPEVFMNQKYTVAVSHLKPGTYFVRMSTSKGTYTKKFIKE